MKVINPTDKEVSLNYKGEIYTINGKSTQDFPESVARHWVYIFQFMSIDNSPTEVKEEVKKEVTKKVTKK